MTSTRIIRDHSAWIPHGYQRRSVDHLMCNRAAALFLDPGLGKTAVVLDAFNQLKSLNMAHRMLVVAPLRVCQLVWQQEGRKWTQFRDLTFSLLHGPKKEERLKEQTDIHLINPEGIAWLSQQYYGRTDLPYDVVTIDELPKFKNARAQRSKLLRKKLSQVKYRWGLTGSPAPNGYMDLFGQMLLLDDGAALGRFITYFRDQYFNRAFDGFTYNLKPEGGARIEARIAPYVLRMSAEDYLTLPPLTDNIITIDLTPAARKQYNEMKKEMIISLPEGVVTAANAAAVYTKLAQLANGAVYVGENTYAEVHTAKLDALEDLVEELAGQPLLVGYQFQHDLARLQERFPGAPTLTGLSHKKIVELEAAWNNGEIPLMFAHPASAGHGLNLQGSGASHVCWFSRPWDLDLYDQFIRRLLRQGTTAQHIMNHALVVKDSIDEIMGGALRDKDVTQQRLLRALNAEVIKDIPRTAMEKLVGTVEGPADFAAQHDHYLYGTDKKGENMALKKLGFQGQPQQGGTAAAAPATPRGWGTPATADAAQAAPETAAAPRPRGWGVPSEDAAPAQRDLINEKLRAPEPTEEDDEEEGPPASARALEMFGEGVVQQLTGNGGQEQEGASAAPTPRGWGQDGANKQAGAETAPAGDTKAPEKAPRARRSASKAPEAADIQAQSSAGPGGDSTAVARNGLDGVGGMFGGVNISFSGLPPYAVAAALIAIAASLQEH